jgi:hypothetical protein
MTTTHDALSTLKHELEFLDHGGYRKPNAARQPLFCMETSADWKPREFFEDSPTCPKRKYCRCALQADCVLKELVPTECLNQEVPCRHIPLNERGDTIESLSKTGSHGQIEASIRTWLVRSIEKLEAQATVKG